MQFEPLCILFTIGQQYMLFHWAWDGKISYMRQATEKSKQHKDDSRCGNINNLFIQTAR